RQTSLEHGEPLRPRDDSDIAVMRPRKFLISCQVTWVERILEVGTWCGYSSIWLGRALPEDVKNVKLLVGPAYDSMVKLDSDKPFDFVFI
ncbi:hypothetical protein MPER_04816, partial [Moniliophthora perniciosa FA553]